VAAGAGAAAGAGLGLSGATGVGLEVAAGSGALALRLGKTAFTAEAARAAADAIRPGAAKLAVVLLAAGRVGAAVSVVEALPVGTEEPLAGVAAGSMLTVAVGVGAEAAAGADPEPRVNINPAAPMTTAAIAPITQILEEPGLLG
jgi:hypothetical protein